MQVYYKKASLLTLALVLLTIGLGVFCLNAFHLKHKLVPLGSTDMPWELVTLSDVVKGGSSSITVNESVHSLDYFFSLSDQTQYPFVSAVIAFDDIKNATRYRDLSRYSKALIRAKCLPKSVLTIHIHAFNPDVTDTKDFSSYRISEVYLSCGDTWAELEFDLRRMRVPAWWQNEYGVPNSDQDALLTQVLAISLLSSAFVPADTVSKVSVSSLTLHGEDWRYVWLFVVATLVIWLSGCVWLLRKYTQAFTIELENKVSEGRPLVAYKELTITPHDDSNLHRIVRYLATEYNRPDLSLEAATGSLGINRTKLNEILKSELGLTFNAYVNKLRLAEAARIIEENDKAIIAEVAYSLGYKNVSYFNKLFKQEYGCTPNRYKSIAKT